MSTYIRYETLLFFQSLCTGALLLLFYDLLRAFRAVVRHGGWWTAAEDLLYWVGVSIFGFAYVYQANQGILRSFLLLGLLLGAWICRFYDQSALLKTLDYNFRNSCIYCKNFNKKVAISKGKR